MYLDKLVLITSNAIDALVMLVRHSKAPNRARAVENHFQIEFEIKLLRAL